MMFSQSFKNAFENWWVYYFLKGLYGYSDEELKEFTNYKPGSPEIEKVRKRWYMSIGKNTGPKEDQIDREEWDMST